MTSKPNCVAIFLLAPYTSLSLGEQVSKRRAQEAGRAGYSVHSAWIGSAAILVCSSVRSLQLQSPWPALSPQKGLGRTTVPKPD